MEKKVKLKLEELRVESFITALDKSEKETVNGGDNASSYPCAVASATGTIVYSAVATETVKATISISGTTVGTTVGASTVSATTGATLTATSVASTASAASLVVSVASISYTVGMSLNYSQEAISEYFSVETSAGSFASNAVSYLGGCSYWPLC